MKPSPPSILIIDDSLADRVTYRRYLLSTPNAYTIVEAELGVEGLAHCHTQKPGVILLDYRLPDLDGLEFLAELHTQIPAPLPPVIMLTGQGNELIAVQAMKAGAEDYLVKGNLTAEKLRLAVSSVLKTAQLHTQLKRSEERLNLALETAHMGIWEWDLSTDEVVWSATLEQLFGLDPGEFTGTYAAWMEQIYPSDRPTVHQLLKQPLDSPCCQELEYRILHPDGTLHWIASQAEVFSDGNNQLQRMVGTAQDITGRKQIEAALRQTNDDLERRVAERTAALTTTNQNLQITLAALQGTQAELSQQNQALIATREAVEAERQRYQDLFEFAPDGYLVTDATGTIQEANQAAARLCGQLPSVLIGQPLSDLMAVPDRSSFATRLAHLNPIQTWEIDLHPATSNAFPVEITVAVVPNRDQPATTLRWLLRDIRDRRQAEMALRESEARFRSLSESSPVGVFETDIQGQCLYTNARWQQIAGLTRDQSLGDGWMMATHPDDRALVAATWTKSVQIEQDFLQEFRFLTPIGDVRWVRAHAAAIRSATGEIVGYVGTDEDITDRKQAEHELREMSLALSNAVEGIARLDSAGRYLSVNEAYANPVGYAPTEMIGMDWQYTVHPDDRPHLIAAYETMLRVGKVEAEARGIRKDGSVFYKQLYMVAAYDDRQQFVGHYCFMKDVSDRKQVEQKLQEQAELINITSDAMIVRDLHNHIIFWNRGAEQLFGWPAVEAIGKNARELLCINTETACEQAWSTVMATGAWQGELTKVTQAGKSVIVASRWTLVRDLTGQPKLILTVDTDITEKIQLERQFLRAQRLESVGTLASGIAHDLNNILTPILSIAQLLPLKFPHLDHSTQELLQMLELSAKRGAALVNQVLTFTRGVEGQPVPLQLKYLLLEMQQIIAQTFPKSIQIEVDLPSDLWLVIGDATHLHQVLMNLCINARDAMPQGGTLTLAAANRSIDALYARIHLDAQISPYVVITVADTGTGMSADIQERIFDPFFTTKDLGKGTGLGLATVLGILKSHQGFINVYSEVGKGSKFEVFLPAVETPLMPAVNEPKPLVGSGELILVVDDEAPIQFIAKTLLESHHYRVIVAGNGEQALDLYTQQAADIKLVVIDMMMPTMDGPTTLRLLRALNPAVKVIAVSGLSVNQDLATQIGAQAFLAKPYTQQELLQKVQDVLHN
jgi:PAS domain S-box-containing protein